MFPENSLYNWISQCRNDVGYYVHRVCSFFLYLIFNRPNLLVLNCVVIHFCCITDSFEFSDCLFDVGLCFIFAIS